MAGTFAVQVSQFRGKTEEQMRQLVRYLCLEISRRVIMRTPVDTGRARGSWVSGFGAVPSGQGGIDKGGSSTLGAVSGVVAGYVLGKTFYLVSNLPYINVLEYGRYPNPPKGGSGKTSGGFSIQAPRGMVRVTLSEFPGLIGSAVQSSKP